MKTKWMALTALSLGLCVQALAQGAGRGGDSTQDEDMSAGVQSSTSTEVSRSTSTEVGRSTGTEVGRSTGTDVFRSTDGVRGYDPGTERQNP